MTQTVVNNVFSERHTFISDLFDIEGEDVPYAAESFDIVLFCEILEHLITDPVAAFSRIHSVLKPDGILIMTTPNAARDINIRRLAAGENIYGPYSRHGILGRHNREYTIGELRELLPNLGFTIIDAFTKYVHFDTPPPEWWNISNPDDKRGDYIFIKAVKSKPFTPYRPNWLYR
jgi:2-polyprenyl-3-methyl-5-hydroxy-6-metoxy-1,4-benzoquinol methylase